MNGKHVAVAVTAAVVGVAGGAYALTNGSTSAVTPPTAVTNLHAKYNADLPSADVSWSRATKGTNSLKIYNVYFDGELVNKIALSKRILGIGHKDGCQTTHLVEVAAVDTANIEGPKASLSLAYPCPA